MIILQIVRNSNVAQWFGTRKPWGYVAAAGLTFLFTSGQLNTTPDMELFGVGISWIAALVNQIQDGERDKRMGI